MGEREKGKESINRGELFFLTHPGKDELFSGYGLTVEEGSKEDLVGILMVDRPKPANPRWLSRVKRKFGEYQLVPMTATGERGVVCQMKIETDSIRHLRQYHKEIAEGLKKALEPLLEEPPRPEFVLSWNEERQLWQSRIAN